MRPVYPFSAVVGQEPLKLSLLLCAIDPAIGGVLVSGPRGVAKTTLARALAELVPGRFVELPLGATEERVTGSLDLDAALREQRVQFAPGLLARAHEGVLYVDEVNLLPDPLVDLLLDAAATGSNTVERDGVSHAHAARFVLVGTMNPDEGELRPQLVDRFGLMASAEGEIAPGQRMEIVTRRLAFEDDPASFVASFAAQQAELVRRCRQAREQVRTIALAGPALSRVSELCHAAGVEGVRADLAMLRAARAHAAWHGRSQITSEDVAAVAELALRHRRRTPPSEPGPRGGGSQGSSSRGGSSPGGGSQDQGSAGEQGALAPVPVRTESVAELPRELTDARGQRAGSGRSGKARVRSLRGARARDAAREGAVDWFRTLVHARRPTHADLRFRARRVAAEQLWILALDCSSSMLRAGGLARAKGVAQALEASAKRAGARVALVSFRGHTARTELVTSAGRHAFSRALAELGGGGGTPLSHALREVLAISRRRSVRARQIAKRLVLLTDGKTREPVTELAPALRELELTVIDCERGPVRLGRARTLASALSGRYLHIDALSGSSSGRAES